MFSGAFILFALQYEHVSTLCVCLSGRAQGSGGCRECSAICIVGKRIYTTDNKVRLGKGVEGLADSGRIAQKAVGQKQQLGLTLRAWTRTETGTGSEKWEEAGEAAVEVEVEDCTAAGQ